MNNNKILSQDQFMRKYNEEHRAPFNPMLFERKDEDIVRALENIILSCQRDRYFTIKVISFAVATDYADIQHILWLHEEKRKKKNKKYEGNPYDNINLRDSDIMILQVKYFIRINASEKRNTEQTQQEMEVLIALPRYVDKYYFKLSGNYYASIFQIVDGCTYNNNTTSSSSKKKLPCVSGKIILNSMRVSRLNYSLTTVDGELLENIALFVMICFSKSIPACKYFLARYGLVNAIDFLGLNGVIFITDDAPDNTADKLYVFFKNDIYISVYKEVFKFNKILQSMVVTIFCNILPDTPFNAIFDIRYWIRILGGEFGKFTDEKGLSILDSFEGIYDIISRENAHLPWEDKCDIFAFTRWIMREFNELKDKDNLDMSTKRLRGAPDYLAAHYAVKLTSSIFRISDIGKGVTLKQVASAIYTSPMYLIDKIKKQCKMIKNIDMVNENDALTALAWTYKGISGLGDQKGKANAIPDSYRQVHPSLLYRVDLETSSPGDPSMGGIVCPRAQLTPDMSFSDYKEPNNWQYEYAEFMDNFRKVNGLLEVVRFKNKIGLDYDKDREIVLEDTLKTYQRLICPIHDVTGQIDYSMDHSMGRKVIMDSMDDIIIPDYVKEDDE